MTDDLFGANGFKTKYDASLASFEVWARMRSAGQAGTSLRAESIDVYRDMWGNFARWCAERDRSLNDIDATDLVSFLDSLGRHGDPSPRYVRKMLSLIDRIDRFAATHEDRSPNGAIAEVKLIPRFRSPEAVDDEPPPEFLTASQAKRVIDLVTTRRADASGAWQDVRDRTAVGLLLGGGITPGEARALTLQQVVVSGGKSRDIPWKLSLPATGVFAARQTPLAGWAGKQLAYWLQVRADQGIPGEQVFPSTRTGKPWSKPSSINAMQAILEQAGLPGEGGTFRLRHTFALRQLTRHSEQEVASWLGLKSPKSMERYRRVLFQPVEIV